VPLVLAVRVWLWRARPALRLAALVVLLLAIARLAAPPQTSTPVVVAARSLPAGQMIAAADLRVVDLPDGRTPHGASHDAAPLVGRTLSVPVPAGLPLVPELLAGRRFTMAPPDGTVVVALDLPEAGILRVGDRVDLLPAGCPGQSEPLAERALVVDLADPTVAGGDEPVLVAVLPRQARALASARDSCPMAAVLVE
jgi:Flp pilus assembly protein CpaB